jgi:hypothetical protein
MPDYFGHAESLVVGLGAAVDGEHGDCDSVTRYVLMF